ncbi:hypothetical protein ACRHM7_17860 [Chromohalobacter israelensis]|uniref:hypothetical protein n=1 Tax=Chromohalobacter israelensis TaxID=141390 RepID=UPI003D7A667C
MNEKETCYMCSEEATSKEHVPPRCLFPKESELSKGVSMRKNLIKVPSCHVHNSSKSKDDEYLMFIMSCAFQGNEFKSSLFEKRVLRAFQKKPHVLDTVFKNPRKVLLRESEDGKPEESISFEADLDRVDSMFHHMACGIYYHHFKEKWLGGSKNIINFLSYLDVPEVNLMNHQHSELNRFSREIFHRLESYGDNHEVFSYRAIKGDDGEAVIFLEFYEQLRATVLLS